VPDDTFAAEVARYEWVQDIGYREFLVPAELVTRVGVVTLDDVDEDPPWLATQERPERP